MIIQSFNAKSVDLICGIIDRQKFDVFIVVVFLPIFYLYLLKITFSVKQAVEVIMIIQFFNAKSVDLIFGIIDRQKFDVFIVVVFLNVRSELVANFLHSLNNS